MQADDANEGHQGRAAPGCVGYTQGCIAAQTDKLLDKYLAAIERATFEKRGGPDVRCLIWPPSMLTTRLHPLTEAIPAGRIMQWVPQKQAQQGGWSCQQACWRVVATT